MPRQPRFDEDPAAARAALRAFVRTHHPDVGGDPEVFAAGLAELRAARRRAERGGAGRGGGVALDDHDRGEAPVVVVRRPRGVRGLACRFRAWRSRKKRGPRVV